MKKFDRTKDYGIITPPWKGAWFHQNGLFYDSGGEPIRELNDEVESEQIEQEEVKKRSKKEVEPKEPRPLDPPEMTANELLNRADTMRFLAFRSHAHRILGSTDLRKKDELIDALLAEVHKSPEGQSSREMLSWDGVSKDSDGKTPAATEDAPQAPPENQTPAVDGEGVDLGAWVRGFREYLMGDVTKAIRETYNRQATTKYDAAQTLIEERVVNPEDVRADAREPEGAQEIQ